MPLHLLVMAGTRSLIWAFLVAVFYLDLVVSWWLRLANDDVVSELGYRDASRLGTDPRRAAEIAPRASTRALRAAHWVQQEKARVMPLVLAMVPIERVHAAMVGVEVPSVLGVGRIGFTVLWSAVWVALALRHHWAALWLGQQVTVRERTGT